MIHLRSLLPAAWPKIPKLRFFIPVLAVVGFAAYVQTLVSNNPLWESRLRSVIVQVQDDLGLIDATLLTRTFWQATSDFLWECTVHPPKTICSGGFANPPPAAFPGTAAPASPLERLRELHEGRSPYPLPSERKCEWQPARKVCDKAPGPERLFSAPGVGLTATARTLWEKLDWLALLLFGTSAGIALALVLGITAGRPGFLLYLVPLLAAPVALLLKWLLIGALAVLGPLVGFAAWVAGLIGGFSFAAKAIGCAVQAYKIAQKLENALPAPLEAGGPAASSQPQEGPAPKP